MYDIELVVDAKALLGEGPFWEENTGLLAWDIHRRTMYYIDTPTSYVAAFDFDMEQGRKNRFY